MNYALEESLCFSKGFSWVHLLERFLKIIRNFKSKVHLLPHQLTWFRLGYTWCLSWNSNTLATSFEELTHWKRPWCREWLGVGGEGDDRGWNGWMASPTWWTRVWVNSGSWWWTGRPGVLQFMGSQRVGHNWATELNWYLEWVSLGRIFRRPGVLKIIQPHPLILYTGRLRTWRWEMTCPSSQSPWVSTVVKRQRWQYISPSFKSSFLFWE